MTELEGPKKLAFLLPTMSGGGAERVALRLIEDFLAAGHALDLLLMEPVGELMPLVPPQVRVVDLKAPRIRNVVAPLVRYLRREKPHGIQVSMWPLTVAGVIAHRLARSPARIVLSEHIVLSKQYGGFGTVGTFLLRNSIRFAYPKATARIAVSKQAADDLAALSGIDRATVDVVYNPVARPPKPTGPNEPAETLWGGAVDRIITVGSLKEQKNHKLLIRTFALLKRRRPEAKLMILGEGELRPELERLATAEGVANDVLMPGFYTDPWPFYLSANVFVLSSDYEGYPLVLIEAMRSGLAVVSTDCESGPSEILDRGRFGKLVACNDPQALADALEQALVTPHDQSSLMARAEALSGQDTSNRYLNLMLG